MTEQTDWEKAFKEHYHPNEEHKYKSHGQHHCQNKTIDLLRCELCGYLNSEVK